MIKVESKTYDVWENVFILELSNNMRVEVEEEVYERFEIGDSYLGDLFIKGWAIIKGNDFLSDFITTTDFNQPHNIEYGNNPYTFKTKEEACDLVRLMEKQYIKGTFKVVEYMRLSNDRDS